MQRISPSNQLRRLLCGAPRLLLSCWASWLLHRAQCRLYTCTPAIYTTCSNCTYKPTICTTDWLTVQLGRSIKNFSKDSPILITVMNKNDLLTTGNNVYIVCSFRLVNTDCDETREVEEERKQGSVRLQRGGSWPSEMSEANTPSLFLNDLHSLPVPWIMNTLCPAT